MMPRRFAWVAAGAVACLALSLAIAAPVPKPVPKGADQWEYCELHFRTAAAREGGWGKGAGGGPGGAGGAGGGPGGAAPVRQAPARVTTTHYLYTEDDRVAASSWEDLATKLKLPPAKKDATATSHKLRVLNHLGRQGWEMVPATGSESRLNTVYLFKRKVTK